jgi:alkylation response protein AidB-like acyl-CoA dehydrogenase
MIGNPGEGLKIAFSGLSTGRINIASCSLGGAWFALEKTWDYMS